MIQGRFEKQGLGLDSEGAQAESDIVKGGLLTAAASSLYWRAVDALILLKGSPDVMLPI